MVRKHQDLPSSGVAREELRQKGQFWTPDWVADAMAAYVLKDGASLVLDPAVGAGSFFRAVRRVATHPVALYGNEIDPFVLDQAKAQGTLPDDLANVVLRDFVLSTAVRSFPAIIGNPPYLRHHRIPIADKAELKIFGTTLIGRALDGRAGLHIYFLLRALTLLSPGGRLAFILPADTCEGKFASDLWKYITREFCLEAVVSFAQEATPFPQVDTNALIFMIKNTPPSETYDAIRCSEPWSRDLKSFIETAEVRPTLTVVRRTLREALATGLSRPARENQEEGGPVLGDFVRVMRGIATGDNDFFFLTRQQALSRNIAKEFLKPSVGRTRDIESDVLTADRLNELDTQGRPTQLLSLDGRPLEEFPTALQEYLSEGKARGLPNRALISQRTPWYRMERREIPCFLFTYLGRRNARFVRNDARALPLTGFLCIYPKRQDEGFLTALWKVLNHPETIAALPSVGKSYGSGAIKVEPRSLERLPLPPTQVASCGLFSPRMVLEQSEKYRTDI